MPRIDYLHIPQTLPQSVDPQIRNYLSQLSIEFAGWSDEVVRELNSLVITMQQIADRIKALETRP